MRIPLSTYRLQFRDGFGFREARAVVPYLHQLGISDIYASPLLRAKAGSVSGYDVVDPTQLDPQLGTQEEFAVFVDELKKRDMGLLLDIVPNHLATHTTNPWWRDVLENGPCSPYAHYFDIGWDPQSRGSEKLVWPILGVPYAEALEKQQLTLSVNSSGFVLRYYELELPIDPATYGTILSYVHDYVHDPNADFDQQLLAEITQLTETSRLLPPSTTFDPSEINRRYREKEELKQRLWNLYSSSDSFRVYLDETIRRLNGTAGDPHSFDLLNQLLSQQPYALSFWKVAREKINYRRFFDIADLVALSAEEREVFVNSHVQIFRLIEQGSVTGLRIDHVDGLYDPYQYLTSLRERFPDLYVVVEKILEPNETLPEDWPVAGTTGYDFLNMAGNLFIDATGLTRLSASYTRLTGDQRKLSDVVYEEKKRVIHELFGGEMLSLALQLGLLAEADRYAKDASPMGLRNALIEVTACLPVYRTYTRSFDVRPQDRAIIEGAVRNARSRNPSLGEAEMGFVERVLLLNAPPSLCVEDRQRWRRFVQRWQQFSGPVMAKGLEDTAFYEWSRLISMNEVGGSDESTSPAQFHRFNEQHAQRWPHSLNAGSTHDTKRGEDARARIDVLSELPDQWDQKLRRWRQWNARAKPILNGVPAPSPAEEIFLYQSLIGAWPSVPCRDEAVDPSFRERIQATVRKSLREAKINTSWSAPNQFYEEAVAQFTNAILESSDSNRFLTDFRSFLERIISYGFLNSLSQTLLRLTAPGVPDIYQGAELWDLNLVDPDNRRPVDFAQREQMLRALSKRPLADLLDKWQDGAAKLYLIHKTLVFRRDHPDVFTNGNYVGFETAGTRSEDLVAFGRQHGATWVVTSVPRLVTKLSRFGKPPLGRRVWRDTELIFPQNAPLRWSNILTDEIIEIPESRRAPAAKLFAKFPGVLLNALPD